MTYRGDAGMKEYLAEMLMDWLCYSRFVDGMEGRERNSLLTRVLTRLRKCGKVAKN